MQVLIIDNDIAYRNGVSMAASNKHWIPVSCGDIRTAKQIISSTLPDLIISDCLYLPQEFGLYPNLTVRENMPLRITNGIVLGITQRFEVGIVGRV